MAVMDKPTRPISAYIQYALDAKAATKGLQQYYIQYSWHELPEEQKQAYCTRYTEAFTKYQKDLQEFYAEHPEVKEKDDSDKKQKSILQRQLHYYYNARLIFSVAHLLKYRESGGDVAWSKNISIMLQNAYNRMDEGEKQAWVDLWQDLDYDKKTEIYYIFQQWTQEEKSEVKE